MMTKLYLTLVELSQQSASEQFLHSWQNRDRRTPVDLAEKRKWQGAASDFTRLFTVNNSHTQIMQIDCKQTIIKCNKLIFK